MSDMQQQTGQSDIGGVEHLAPQITLRCVDCEQMAGEEEIGGYFTYEAADIPKAVDEACWHIIDGAVVCDNCAYARAAEVPDE